MSIRNRVAPMTGQGDAERVFGIAGHRGIGMLEFLIALLIFSMGMMGLLSAQLAGKKASYEASQRSVATSLARDILERIRANPGQIAAYRVNKAGDASHRLPLPGADCDTSACSAAQLAVFDLWQWESLLVGETEQYPGGHAGGLVAPRACIAGDGGQVVVTISWRGAATSAQAPGAVCGSDGVAGSVAPGDAGGDMDRRHQISIATFIGAH